MERGDDSDANLDEFEDDDAVLAATGVYKGRVPFLGFEGIRLLQNSRGASSSSHQVNDERDEQIARLDQEIAQQRAEREKEERRTRERMAEFERQMKRLNATYRPTMHIQHPEMTPQVPFMGNMGGMAFGNYSHLSPNFLYSYYDQPHPTPGGRSSRGGSRAGSRGGARGNREPEQPRQLVDDDNDDDDNDDA
ncbi:unnamed protein product [Cuscuta europaea]|uniref:Uncharacterized protein n=1 Tax=Cuscuta europaea TaxID=41803 RepID=A0A9P1EGD0_CUSEU|nr:unnamed protein product [Cuscuta europaea]